MKIYVLTKNKLEITKKQSKCPSSGEWINCDTFTQCNATLKGNELLRHTSTLGESQVHFAM